jgi:hypothetical protein
MPTRSIRRDPNVNPFQTSGPLDPADMIDRDREVADIGRLVDGGHPTRLVAPRRYGKTTVLGRVLRDAEQLGRPTAHVDLLGVLTLAAIVTRIERAYSESLKGPVRRAADALLRSWNIGVSLGGGGFTASIATNPRIDVESVLLRLLELPTTLAARTGTRSVIVWDEIQDILRVEGADGIIRSVIQRQVEDASHLFAGSSPTLMNRLFASPSRPFLDHALPLELAPLPLDEVAAYVEARFADTGRDAGNALQPLLDLTRGHPQRTMLLAHHLWALVPQGSIADEGAWVQALTTAARQQRPLLEARFQELPTNEQRMAVALANAAGGSVYEEAVYARVGLKRGSIRKTLDTLEGRGDVIRSPHGPRLTDPLLEHWLADRGPY